MEYKLVLSQLQECYRKLQKSITKIQEPANPENHPRIISADNSKTLQKYSPAPTPYNLRYKGHLLPHQAIKHFMWVQLQKYYMYVSDAFW